MSNGHRRHTRRPSPWAQVLLLAVFGPFTSLVAHPRHRRHWRYHHHHRGAIAYMGRHNGTHR